MTVRVFLSFGGSEISSKAVDDFRGLRPYTRANKRTLNPALRKGLLKSPHTSAAESTGWHPIATWMTILCDHYLSGKAASCWRANSAFCNRSEPQSSSSLDGSLHGCTTALTPIVSGWRMPQPLTSTFSMITNCARRFRYLLSGLL
jgi:hypothetical protein